MNKNELIIYEMNKLDLYELTSQQNKQLAVNLLQNINIKHLEEKIHNLILKLSSVADPCFGADIKYIALDNQKRLNLVYMLLYNLDNLKADIKYMKKHIDDYSMDSERVLSFNYKVKELVDVLFTYGDFRKTELKEIKQHILLNRSDKELMNEALDGLKNTLLDLKKILKEE